MPQPAVTRRQAVQALPSLNPITNFTRVVKTQQLSDVAAKKALVVELPSPSPSLKRKASSIQQDTDRRRIVSFSPRSDGDEHERAPLKRARRAGPSPAADCIGVSSPSEGKRFSKAAPSKTKTAQRPSQSTIIAKALKQGRRVQTRIDAVYQKKADKAKANREEKSLLPPHLFDMIALNRAFLKTIMIQIAHSGSTAPIDMRMISPNVSRTWGKRQVTVEDIRRCIAVQSHGPEGSASPFIITDYGRGRVCVELASGVEAASIREDRLCSQFEDNIRALCAEKATDGTTDVHVPLQSLSLSDLPQAAVANKTDGLQTNPLVARGQSLLSGLKSDIAAKQQGRQDKQHRAAAQTAQLLNPDGTKMSLLDRLRHKQLAKANEPLAPSGPDLQRRAALNRVVDVAATISMLSLSNPLSLPRQAFTMLAISNKLRDSLRVPLSKEEGVACVRLIAAEIAPEWLRIVAIGGRENVVIQRHGQPIDRVIRERVQRLLAA
ncbi:uncharacterized protein MAM_05668 [Metarhizium album ARSEF 1941]|uniref:DNA replication factor Cdt1 C-terminal domain-containing protein n=1 Tax=Metarhizium album (strain ARSEF 1941) TaxID=1081103 RepID=A0A0B2WRW4_METAS|nr:uncharacterized protein MAM_05668 [Metarhizium album ARSEF 1941]KHN96379.1 hypothetical protein MAM_05668 [Metarhizium album ARSEF 1941]